MPENAERLLATAREAARVAARVHREASSRGGGGRVAVKTASSDFVSEVDMAAQAAAMGVIAARHPDHAILAEEEGGGRDGASGNPYLWLVDPLDGTTNFLHGHPYYAASTAVWDGEGPLAAAVDAQALGKVWTAARGRGAHENGEPIRVSRTDRIDRFLLGTGFPFKSHELIPGYLAQLDRALRRTAGVRRTGAAAIDLAYVANGTLDGFWESRLAPWDYGAGVLLVTEAGGVAERIGGGPLGVDAGSVMAANSPRALAGLRRVLSGGRPSFTATPPPSPPSPRLDRSR